MSANAFAPFFRFGNALPDILPERSKISTISTGFAAISGSAVKDNRILKASSQGICVALNCLSQFVTPVFLIHPLAYYHKMAAIQCMHEKCNRLKPMPYGFTTAIYMLKRFFSSSRANVLNA